MKFDEGMNERKASHHMNYYDIRQLIMSHFAIKTLSQSESTITFNVRIPHVGTSCDVITALSTTTLLQAPIPTFHAAATQGG